MGRKVTAFSDLSGGAEVPEDELGRLVICQFTGTCSGGT
jgi:hypothetical protein